MEREKLTGGEAKIAEYAARITAGEALESVTEGLPPGMKKAVEDSQATIPPQYEGLNSEILEEIWTIPVYLDPEKTKSELAKKERGLEAIRVKERGQEITTEEKNITEAEKENKITELKQELGATPKLENTNRKSPELIENIESLSLENFAAKLTELARNKSFKIGNAYDILTARPEFRNLKVAELTGEKGAIVDIYNKNQDDIKRYGKDAQDNMRATEGTTYKAGTWDHYTINEPTRERKERHKGYLTINKDQVLAGFTAEVKKEIVERLRDGGYHGQVKFPPIGSRALFSYDNIVLHGDQEGDVDTGVAIAQQVLSERGLNYEAPHRGIDAEGKDGKHTSYTNRIAQIVEDASKDQSIDIAKEIAALKA